MTKKESEELENKFVGKRVKFLDSVDEEALVGIVEKVDSRGDLSIDTNRGKYLANPVDVEIISDEETVEPPEEKEEEEGTEKGKEAPLKETEGEETTREEVKEEEKTVESPEAPKEKETTAVSTPEVKESVQPTKYEFLADLFRKGGGSRNYLEGALQKQFHGSSPAANKSLIRAHGDFCTILGIMKKTGDGYTYLLDSKGEKKKK